VTDSHDVQAGETVLVHAAGGGVGLLLCQLAAQRGASVIGLASSADKRAAASAAGAKRVFGYDNWTEEVRAAVGPVDVVYDSVGSTLGDSLALARTGGHIVFYGMAGGDPVPVDPRMLMDRSLSLTGGDLWNILTSAAIRQQRATMLFDAIMSGAVSVKIAARFPLSDGAEAHRLLQGRTVIGKVLLIIS
jgi:NADPH:quinone reductase